MARTEASAVLVQANRPGSTLPAFIFADFASTRADEKRGFEAEGQGRPPSLACSKQLSRIYGL